MEKIANITNHKKFHKIVSFVIVLCSVVLGLETLIEDKKYIDILGILDIGITLFFIIEIIMRILAERSPAQYFSLIIKKPNLSLTEKKTWTFSENGFWNWFDFLITLGSAIALIEHLFVHPEYLFITRLFRIFRIFRLLEISEKMRDIERKIANIIPTVFSFAMLIFVLVYIYAIIGFYLFKGMNAGAADFSNLSQSIVTMFRVMTLDGWGDIMKAAEAKADYLGHWVFVVFFISFIAITVILTLNIFIAVLASNVELKMTNNKKGSTENHQPTHQVSNEDMIWLKQEFSEMKKEIINVKSELQKMKK